MKFLRDSLTNLLAIPLSSGINILTNVIIARSLGPEGKGIYSILILWGTTIVLFVNLGLGQAAIYYVGQKKYPDRQVANNLLAMALLLGLLAALVAAVLSFLWRVPSFDGVSQQFILIVACLTPFEVALLYAGHLFAAWQDFIRYNLLSLLTLFVRLVVLSSWTFFTLRPTSLIVAIVIGTIIPAITGWGLIIKKLGGIVPKLESSLLKDFFSYGVRSYSTTFVSYMNLRLDQLLIGVFLSTSQLGIYSVAVMFAEIAMKLASTLSMIVFARVASINNFDAITFTSRVARFTVSISVASSIVISLLSSYLITYIFGEQFLSAILPLYILLPGSIVFSLVYLLYSDLAGRGKPQIGIYASIASFAITFLGNLLFVKSGGIIAVAIISTFAYLISAVITVKVYLKLAEQTLWSLIILRKTDITLLISVFLGMVSSSRIKAYTKP